MTIYNYEVRKANGESTTLEAYKNKALLIVNTASQCGLTPQYAELQQLHERYGDKGLSIVGFPCNQFGEQEPGSAEEIAEFCSLNYGVTFPVLAKIEVNGPGSHPLYRYLTDLTGEEIRWNFTKFLVGADGLEIARFEPQVKPLELTDEIEQLLR
ncbi:glutathione peroxidase [Cohnella panacarvi]|uniref:glutathione peroxidase n=1 Tax=Cohnella panacarvi TaxID=400776 RepID=UPI00047D3DBC|nr:glutathione peroxidase [Cohnella panacarvi]